MGRSPLISPIWGENLVFFGGLEVLPPQDCCPLCTHFLGHVQMDAPIYIYGQVHLEMSQKCNFPVIFTYFWSFGRLKLRTVLLFL